MNDHRKRMNAAFASRFSPGLRARGFSGAFPHFRRRVGERLDLVSINVFPEGGRFVVELGRFLGAGRDGWEELPEEKLTASHAMRDRGRLTPRDAPAARKPTDQWQFGPRLYDDPRPVREPAFYEALAEDALAAFAAKGETWFERPPLPPEAHGPASPHLPWPFRSLFGSRFTHLLPWNGRRLRIACLIDTSDRLLHRWDNLQPLVAPLAALAGRVERPASIRSFQARRGGPNKWLPFGSLPLSEASARIAATRYLESGEEIDFDKTEIWAPSRSKWVEEGGQPELYVKIDWNAPLKRQGFVLALRHDRLAAAAAEADRVIASVRALVPGASLVIFDRLWSETTNFFGRMQGNPLDYTDSAAVAEWASAHPHLRVESFAS